MDAKALIDSYTNDVARRLPRRLVPLPLLFGLVALLAPAHMLRE